MVRNASEAFLRIAGLLVVLAFEGLGCTARSAPPAAATQPSLPKDPTSLEALGRAQLRAGRWVLAERSFRALVLLVPDDPDAHVHLGVAYERQGDARAESEYRRALLLSPTFDVAAINLSALYIDAGRVGDALAVVRAGLAASPHSVPLRTNLAIALGKGGDSGGARSEFDMLENLRPRPFEAMLTYVDWLVRAADVAGATRLLDALGRECSDASQLTLVGHQQRLLKAFASCSSTFDKVLAKTLAAYPLTERALCKGGINDEAGAFADLSHAVRLEPPYVPAHLYLANALARMRRWEESALHYEQVVKLDANGPFSATARERLRKIRSVIPQVAH